MQRMWSTYLESASTAALDKAAPVPAAAAGGRRLGMDPNNTRRTSSVMSVPNSLASSQRHILVPDSPLEPPSAPFAATAPGSPKGSSFTRSAASSALALGLPPNTPGSDTASLTNSLSINYFPAKFTRAPSPGGGGGGGSLYKRRGKSGSKSGGGGDEGPAAGPKTGGGREAFRSNEPRMPGAHDDDYDGVDVHRLNASNAWKPRLRWNRFKWVLFLSNLLVSIYSLIALVFCLLTWLNVWHRADVVRVGNRGTLIASTVAAALSLLTALLGWAGILLNNRGFLALYTFLLWVSFALILVPGYMAYKTRTFNLEGKINAQWSRALGASGRARVQDALGCCGYYNPFIEATATSLCYARSVLPGCKSPYLKFERVALERWYAAAFALVPLQIGAILAALLCANHVTYRFGKGMMPKRYRLSADAMAVIMDNYANQLAEQYGSDTAAALIERSRSNLQLDTMPSLAYDQSRSGTPGTPGMTPGEDTGKRF